MTPTPHRRFRFGLRTLFVLVVIVAMPCAWVGQEYRVVLHRRAYSPRFMDHDNSVRAAYSWPPDEATIPWVRTLLGDSPWSTLLYDPLKDVDGSELRRVRQLFPEAHIWGWSGISDEEEKLLPKGMRRFPRNRHLMI